MSLLQFRRQTRASYADVRRFVLFGLVGVSGMAVDLGVLSFLLPLTSNSVSRAVAIGVAMTWNFGCNRAITFRDVAEGSLLLQYWRFVVSCSVGAAINWSASLLLAEKVPFFREHFLLSASAGIALGYLLNFQLCRRWVFGSSQAD